MALTDKDLNNIKNIVEVTIDEKLDEVLETKLVTKDNISHLPTKDEFYEKMDEVVGKLKVIREDYAVVTHRVSNHEHRITQVEKKLQIQPVI
jgi:hypothetical protein